MHLNFYASPDSRKWLPERESFEIERMFISFHSFGHFYSAPSSPLLLTGAPDYSTNTVSEFHAEAHRQL